MEQFIDSLQASKTWNAVLPFVQAIILIVIGWLVTKIVKKWLKKILEKTKMEMMLHDFIMHTIEIVLWVIIIIAALGKLGIDSSSIITIVAACGAAVALALQGFLSNLASGIVILVSHPFRTNDYIVSAGVEGTVTSIDLLHTTVITADKKTVTIPNSALTGNSVTNLTTAGIRRIDIRVGVDYSTDVNLARKALVDMVNADSRTLQTPKAECDVSDYADSAITLFLRFWVNTADYWGAYFNAYNSIQSAFAKAGIEVPFPQLDVHLDKQ